MHINEASAELRFALKTAREAAVLAEAVRTELVNPSIVKLDKSPVSVADFSVQALISFRLQQAFPADPLVGEEDAQELRKVENAPLWENVQKYVRRFLAEISAENILSFIDRGGGEPSGRFWVLDPIDGTKGFLRQDQYAVALALIENGKVRLGVLACPNLRDARSRDVGGTGTLAFAEAGKGAWFTPLKKEGPVQPMKVSSCSDVAESVLLRSSDEAHMDVDKTKKLLETGRVTKPPVEMSSLAKHVMLASGAADFFLRLLPPKSPEYREKIWDQAPGIVMIQEAGGLLTDSDGKPLDFTRGRTLADNRGLLGANAALHPKILSILKSLT
jgi:3'(2'), 5'-bisphosphate nucleotidase